MYRCNSWISANITESLRESTEEGGSVLWVMALGLNLLLGPIALRVAVCTWKFTAEEAQERAGGVPMATSETRGW